jgi:hypothetical protein
LITGTRSECITGTVAGFARPRRAVKPNAASRRAEGAGLDGESAGTTVKPGKQEILDIDDTFCTARRCTSITW